MDPGLNWTNPETTSSIFNLQERAIYILQQVVGMKLPEILEICIFSSWV